MMEYFYQTEKHKLWTEENVRNLFKVRDQVDAAIKKAGVVDMASATKGLTGNGWEHMAMVDFLVEIKELEEVEQVKHPAGQHRIFKRPWRG